MSPPRTPFESLATDCCKLGSTPGQPPPYTEIGSSSVTSSVTPTGHEVLTLGAGDLTSLPDELQDLLRQGHAA